MKVREYDKAYGTHYERQFHREARLRRARRAGILIDAPERFLLRRIEGMSEGGFHADIDQAPLQRPHLQRVDDAYHERMSYRRRLERGSHGGLRERLGLNDPNPPSDINQ